MKAATIVPQKYLHLIENQNYHMALAHLIGKAGFEAYTEFYSLIGKNPDKFLIMDNGLIEGDPRPIEEIVEKAERLHASELVLPDVFRDRNATYRAVNEALVYIHNKGKFDMQLMAVAQGNTYEEWLSSARELLQLPISTLGIPKVLTKLPYYGTSPEGYVSFNEEGNWMQRLDALKALREELDATDVEIHLLGCWDTPLEAKRIANAVATGDCHEVRGIDSAIPWVYANSGMKMSEGERPVGPVHFDAINLSPNDINLKYNIHMWQRECADMNLEDPDNAIPYFW